MTEEQVKAKRYPNSDRVPAVGDFVDTGSGPIGRVCVGQLGGVPDMFQNCQFGGVFVLTHPENVTYVGD